MSTYQKLIEESVSETAGINLVPHVSSVHSPAMEVIGSAYLWVYFMSFFLSAILFIGQYHFYNQFPPIVTFVIHLNFVRVLMTLFYYLITIYPDVSFSEIKLKLHLKDK